jgi:hypothetical protein
MLLLVTGCKTLDSFNFLFLQNDNRGNERVIVASLDSVSQSIQANLGQLGMAANVSRKGDTIYIASKTLTGTKFTFVLVKEKSKAGEQTRVYIEWENGKDDQMGLQILGQIEAQVQR